MACPKITTRAAQRMLKVLSLRRKGWTLEKIGRNLKVTRERVRQIEKLAHHLISRKVLCPFCGLMEG